MLYRHVFIEEDLCRMLLCLSCNFDSQQFIEFTRAIPSQIISLGSSMLLVEFRADLSSHVLTEGLEFQTVRGYVFSPQQVKWRTRLAASACGMHLERSSMASAPGKGLGAWTKLHP